MTKQGRIAVLTNFREHGKEYSGDKSRGAMVNAFLTTPKDSDETTAQFAKRLVEDVGVTDVGGFSLCFGRIVPPSSRDSRPGLAIVSNRSENVKDITWITKEPGEIHGLSNSHFGDLSWPKVVHGEQLTRQAIHSNVSRKAGKQDLIERLFDVLSVNTLPRRKNGEDWDDYVYQLRNSIFIPRLDGGAVENRAPEDVASARHTEKPANANGSGTYGTQKQTIILVDIHGKATFLEKTLYDENYQPVEDSIEEFSFDIEGWGV